MSLRGFLPDDLVGEDIEDLVATYGYISISGVDEDDNEQIFASCELDIHVPPPPEAV